MARVSMPVYPVNNLGVYKQWTGLLEWWNSGMVEWIVFYFIFIIIML